MMKSAYRIRSIAFQVGSMRSGSIQLGLWSIVLAFLALVLVAEARTITAASSSSADVQTAVNAAVAGDTVVIPADSCTWTSEVNWTAPANVILQGAGS